MRVIRCGFRRIVLLNWHYENASFVYEAGWLAHERARVPRVPDHGRRGGLLGAVAAGDGRAVRRRVPELVLFDRAVDDEAARHPFYDVIPVPGDFVPRSGARWKATRAIAAKGASAWGEIGANLEDANGEELGAPAAAIASIMGFSKGSIPDG